MIAIPIAPFVLVIIFSFGIGIICLGWPRKIQGLSMSSCARLPSWYLKYFPFAAWTKKWVERPSYIWYLRVVGIFSLAFGSFLLFILSAG